MNFLELLLIRDDKEQHENMQITAIIKEKDNKTKKKKTKDEYYEEVGNLITVP